VEENLKELRFSQFLEWSIWKAVRRYSVAHKHTRGSIWLLVVAVLLGSLAIDGGARASANETGLMDYRDVAELGTTLQALAAGSSHAQLFTIGYSTDYKTTPNSPRRYPIYAIRISASTDETLQDDYRKNSILFEAGTHPREWLATESTLMLTEYLVNHAEDTRSRVPNLLAGADIWIIPLTTPAGRAIDDQHGGDPTRYSTTPLTLGWRGDGDTRGCAYGVNVARNFSSGWIQETSSDCINDPGISDSPDDYRGFAPFSTEEATALRTFVHNHSISMAVVIHSPDQKIWNMWKDTDVAGTAIVSTAKALWDAGVAGSDLQLARESVGNGQGQFSAWLSSSSDTAGEPDMGTLRGIQTFFIELPFDEGKYTGEYRDRANDTSNRFHPSSAHVRDLVRGSFIPMAQELIYQSRSPGCPTLGDRPWLAKCPARDFGLTGAKIGPAALMLGQLESAAARCDGTVQGGTCNGNIQRARNHLIAGQYRLYYRVQNFSTQAGYDDVDVRLMVAHTTPEGGETVVSRASFSNLAVQEARTGTFMLYVDHPGADYTVTLEVRPAGGFSSGAVDGFTNNDKKVFMFRAYSL